MPDKYLPPKNEFLDLLPRNINDNQKCLIILVSDLIIQDSVKYNILYVNYSESEIQYLTSIIVNLKENGSLVFEKTFPAYPVVCPIFDDDNIPKMVLNTNSNRNVYIL